MTEFRFYEGKEKGKKAKKRDGITIDIATIWIRLYSASLLSHDHNPM